MDGIPLCLEMVASHVAYLSPEEIADRLEDRFSLLEEFDPSVPARHRTMRETLAWQVDTLHDQERLLLARLAVFVGLFDLKAAEAVGGTPPLNRLAVLRHLRALADKSLLVVSSQGTTTGYRLLEIVEQFASTMPEGQTVAAEPAFVTWATELAEEANAKLYGEGHEDAILRLDRTYNSLRRALDVAIERRHDDACRLALGLSRYWMYRGLYSEALASSQKAEEICAVPNVGARLANAIGVFADRNGAPEVAEASYRRALASEAEPQAKVGAMTNLAILMNGQDRLEEAIVLYHDAIEAAERVGDGYTRRLAEYNIGQAYLDLGRYAEGETAILAAAVSFRRVGDLTRVALCLGSLAGAAAARDDASATASHLRDCLEILGADPDAHLWICILIEAAWLAQKKDHLLCARLLGAYEQLRETTDTTEDQRCRSRRESLDLAQLAQHSQGRAEGRTAEQGIVRGWIQQSVDAAPLLSASPLSI